MPFERPEDQAARRASKARRAKRLALQQLILSRAVEARLLLTLKAQFLRGFDELAALLRVSPRLAAVIAARKDFVRAKRLADRTRVWKTEAVIAWIEAQPDEEL